MSQAYGMTTWAGVPVGKSDACSLDLLLLPVQQMSELIWLRARGLDREKFEGMKNEYYDQRGWDKATGIPTG